MKAAFESRKEVHPSGRVLYLSNANRSVLDYLSKQFGCDILYCLSKTDTEARIKALSVSEYSFACKKALPESWRGLRDAELEKVTGIAGSVFVHKSGFLGVWRTEEGMLKAMQYIMGIE